MIKDIKEVKEVKDFKESLIGYLVNKDITVPISDDNKDYQLVKEWLAVDGNLPEPYMTQEEKDKADQEVKIKKALDYLSKTDLYYIRELSRGIKVPQEIKDNREVYIAYLESVGYSTKEILENEDIIK